MTTDERTLLENSPLCGGRKDRHAAGWPACKLSVCEARRIGRHFAHLERRPRLLDSQPPADGGRNADRGAGRHARAERNARWKRPAASWPRKPAYRAGHFEELIAYYPSPGVLSERMWIFVARDLTAGEPAREANEEIENFIVSWDEALAMIDRGEIHDGKTIMALLTYDRSRSG